MKASNIVAPAKTTKEVPDLEEAMEEEDDEVAVEPKEEDDDEADLKKDKYIKQPKAKKQTAERKAAPKKASKTKAKNDDEDEDDEDDGSEEGVKPKKAAKPRGRPAGAKGKGKK